MKRPFMPVALCYSAGLLCAEFLPLPISVLWIASALLILSALCFSRARPLLLALALVSIGWVNLTGRVAVLSPHDLRTLLGGRTEIVAIRGHLVERPTLRMYPREEQPFFRSVARVDLDAILLNGAWQPAQGRIVAGTRGELSPEWYAGRRVEISGVIGPPPGPPAPGLFDYRRYLRLVGIHYSLRSDSPEEWKQIDDETAARPPLSDRFLSWSQRTLARGIPHPDESLRLLWAMVLGWKTALTDEVSASFMQSGTMHIFAISGLHIALIAGVLVALARTLQIQRGVCGLLVVPLLWFYTAATGWQSSAVRSTIMMSIVIAGWALKRPSDLLNSLAGAAFIILVWDPLQVFQAGFQLSFFVVLSIALFLPPIEKWLNLLWQPDPLLPVELRPRWQRWLGRPARWLAASFATSLAAWLGSLPLTAWYFHILNPISLLANLVIVPLSSLALMSGLGSLCCGDWQPRIGELFNHAAWWWMTVMVRASEWAASVRGGWWNVTAPGPLFFLFYYVTLVAALAGWLVRPKFRPWSVSAVLLLATAWGVESWRARSETKLTVLAISGGHVVFLDQPGRANDWLMDTASSSGAEFVTLPFLRAQGVNRLAHLVLTQGDVRQMGGAELVSEMFRPREFVTSTVTARSPYYRKFTADLAALRRPWRKANRGASLAPWRVLHPDATDRFAQADDNTLVLAGEFAGTRVLLLSDLGRDGQEALLRRETDLRADIVVAGLPTKDEPLCDALLEAVKPKLIVLTDSELPATRRAAPALRQRLAQRGTTVLYTRETGAIRVHFSHGSWRVTPMTPEGAGLSGPPDGGDLSNE